MNRVLVHFGQDPGTAWSDVVLRATARAAFSRCLKQLAFSPDSPGIDSCYRVIWR